MDVAAAHEPRAAGEHGPRAGSGAPGCATEAQRQQEPLQQPQDGQEQQQSPPPDPPAARQQLAADALAAQFQAQLEALTAILLGQVAPDSLVLAACGGRIPPAAVVDLAEAAAAERQRRANGAAADARQQDAGAGDGDGEPSEAERLQGAIRAKLRRLAPQQRRLQEDVLQERQLLTQTSEFELLDWRRMRRPLPGANPRAFEPPLQPTALLLQQQAVRAQRAAAQARAERAALQRQHEQRQAPAAQQQQQSSGGGPPAAAGGADGGANGKLGASHVQQLLHPVNPFLLKREQRLAGAPEAPPQAAEADGLDEKQHAPPQQATS